VLGLSQERKCIIEDVVLCDNTPGLATADFYLRSSDCYGLVSSIAQ